MERKERMVSEKRLNKLKDKVRAMVSDYKSDYGHYLPHVERLGDASEEELEVISEWAEAVDEGKIEDNSIILELQAEVASLQAKIKHKQPV